MSLDDPVVTAEPWPGSGGIGADPVAVMVRKLGEAIVEAARWRLCAGEWKTEFEKAEARAADAEQRLATALAILQESAEQPKAAEDDNDIGRTADGS